MSSNSSPVPPDIMPPVAKVLALIFSTFMTLTLLAFIGFIVVEFTADMAGHPLWTKAPDSMEEDWFSTEQDTEEESKSPFELIAPKHQTQMLGPEVVVIYTVRTSSAVSPDLRVNDIQYSWDMQYGSNTWFARLQLPEGLHNLRAGEAEAELFVTVPDSTHYLQDHLPELWQRHHPHPDTNKIDRCAGCHEISGISGSLTDLLATPRSRTVGAWKGVASCFACHEEEEHKTVHRFVLPMTDRTHRCVRCHSIH